MWVNAPRVTYRQAPMTTHQPQPPPAEPAPGPAGARSRGGRAGRRGGEGLVSRRTVLAAAAAGGGGVAAARLLGLHRVAPGDLERSQAAPVLSRSGLDWVSPLGAKGERARAEEARIAHLLRRTTFGASAAELDRAVADGFERTVERQIDTPAVPPPPLPGAETATNSNALPIDKLQLWWLDHMRASPTPFAEKMTLFWHGHFTSEYRKVGLGSPFMYWQNLTWRTMALGDLRSMLMQVTTDPAMLRYLDLSQSTGGAPNENYARELMELFTMGPEAYGEDDVRAAAKALAGWREPRTPEMVDDQVAQQVKSTGKAPVPRPQPDTVKTGIFEKGRAFTGGGTLFLGGVKAWDTGSLIDRILEKDETAPFLARKALSAFVSPAPADATVRRLADAFRKTGYNVRELMRSVLLAPEFSAPQAYRALVKGPTEFMLHAVKALQAPTLTRLVQQSGFGMGQGLFDPPSVGGWGDHEFWVTSNDLLARANFVTAALGQVRKLPPSDDAHHLFLDAVLSPGTLDALNAAHDEKARWTLVLASPEFQLK